MAAINTNVKALAAQSSMSNVDRTMQTSMQRLSTGLRINNAKDDAAGLAIANRMTSDIRGFAVAIRNANDGLSMAQTADGALGQVTDMLQRMRELAVQAGNGSLNADNRIASQLEIDQLKQQIDNIATQTNFNSINLLDGSAGNIKLQTNVRANQQMTMSIDSAQTKDIGLGSRASLTATGFSGVSGSLAKNMAAGDLIINGVQVGATAAASDLVSVNDKSSSAIAKVAAINAVSAQTGVTATIGNTQAAGSAMTVAAASGNLTINGVSTSTIATVGDAGLDRAAVVTAINNISQQTGVRAVDTGDINKGVIMIADDGRNISLNYGGTLTNANTGLGKFATTRNGTTQAAGVTTSVLANAVATDSAATDTLTINGVTTAALTLNASLSTIATKINAITGTTGVTATVTGTAGTANWQLQLTSTNGNANVVVNGSMTTSVFGSTQTAQTYTGTYQLGSSNGSPIVVGSTSNGDLRTAGLTAGTYTANTSVATTTDRAVATAAPDTATTGLLQAGTLRINGASIVAASTADDTSSAAYVAGTTTAITSSAKGASAIAIAAAINKSSATTGVTATAAANVVSGTSFDNSQTVTAKNLYVNGVTVSLATLTTGYTRGDVATLINAQQGQTGVVATDNGRGLTLTAADGRNISLGLDNNISATAVGITGASIGAAADTTGNDAASRGTVGISAASSATTYARVTLSSDKSFTVEGGSDGNANFALLGFKTGTFGGVDNGVKVSKIDITTQAGAQVAITALDAALKSVSLNQARLGAFQNRLDQVVSNLTTMNQNMSASRSRVQDADYATETTNLAKSQIISQAATAMLAQANQSSQSVLALLK